METLKEELDKLNLEMIQLEETLNMKQGTLLLLQERRREEEKKALRQQTTSMECLQNVATLNAKIQEEKLRRKKLRKEFEQQLEELMQKHKELMEFHTPQRLLKEISNLMLTKEQLLEEEKAVQEKLDALEKQIADLPAFMTKEEMMDEGTESVFLHSKEAAATMHLFEEENKKAMEFLEAASQKYEMVKQKSLRKKMEMETFDQLKTMGADEDVVEAAAEGACAMVDEGPMEQCIMKSSVENEQNIDFSSGKHPDGQA
ncbi:synaptonemal complex central element protein 1 isoform X1 [Sarcophilus harrisii]|nr:synaptonemal complex central element protein 1 isoform X1 [Sarcophilus harrisii]